METQMFVLLEALLSTGGRGVLTDCCLCAAALSTIIMVHSSTSSSGQVGRLDWISV